jgi:hypothetical protein
MKSVRGLLSVVVTVLFVSQVHASPPVLGIPQMFEGPWMIRHNRAEAAQAFAVEPSNNGFVCRARRAPAADVPQFVAFHRRLEKAVTAIAFEYVVRGDGPPASLTLYDAAANVLWQRPAGGAGSNRVVLSGLAVRGELVFVVHRPAREPAAAETSYEVRDLGLTFEEFPPKAGPDGFVGIESLAELRAWAHVDGARVRLRPGVYRLDRALYHHFVEFTANNAVFDLTDVRIQADTTLFSRFGEIPGNGGFYCVFDVTGDRLTIEGAFLETYGNQPGLQSRNKIINIAGVGVTLRNVTVRAEGSAPWGYGSLFGIGGGPVRKMNGIRIGAPAQDVRLIGCIVHMRAMGHGIFVQGADRTVIEDCHVDGLLRPTNDILAETAGFAFEQGFRIRGNGEGVKPAEDGAIPRDDMVSLSEDGIRLYPHGGDRVPTGETKIVRCTVTRMRRGICTGLGPAADEVVDCTVTDCIAAGFNVGTGDVLRNCGADAKFAEALSLPYNDSTGARVELGILDSRGGLRNDLLAKINGVGHDVTLHVTRPEWIPGHLRIELASNDGYLGRNAGYGTDWPEGTAAQIALANHTPARVVIPPNVTHSRIISAGPVENGNATNLVDRP